MRWRGRSAGRHTADESAGDSGDTGSESTEGGASEDNTDGDTGSDSGSSSRPDLSTNSLDEDGIRFARETRQRPVGFIQVDTEFEEDAVETATHRFRVHKSYLESTGVDVESVRLYRGEIDSWRTLPTDMVRETEEYYQFEAETPGFSVFVIGTNAPIFEPSAPRLESFNQTTCELRATVTVENIGNRTGVYDSVLIADGRSIGRVEQEIASGATVEISVSGTVESTGTVGLRFAGQSLGEVTRGEAVPEPSMTRSWLWLLGVGLLVVLGLLWRRRTTDDGQ